MPLALTQAPRVSRARRTASLKGVYARLRGLWASGALQTRDLREGGLRNDPGSAAHHSALARFMLRRARDTRESVPSACALASRAPVSSPTSRRYPAPFPSRQREPPRQHTSRNSPPKGVPSTHHRQRPRRRR
jgi:hypothetical protein